MMEREDIARLAGESLERFKPSPSEAYRFGVLTTSGTSGKGALVRLIELEREGGRSAYVEEWRDKSERIIVAYGSRCTRLLQLLALRKAGAAARGIALDSGDLGPELDPLLEDMEPTRVVGAPSFMLRIAEHAPQAAREHVRSLRCAGERLTAAQQALLRQSYPRASIDVTYTSIETGTISKPLCGYLPPNHYHVREGVNIALANQDEDGVGDIVVDVPGDRIIPIRQYRIGDLGRLRDELCACGERRTLEVLGRKGIDYIKLAGAILRAGEFDRVSHLVGAWDDYRAEASGVAEGGVYKGKVVIRAYQRAGRGTAAFEREVAERFAEALYLTPTQTLADLVRKGTFVPLEIVYVDKPFPVLGKVVPLRLVEA